MSSSISNTNNYLKSKRGRSNPPKKTEITIQKLKNNDSSENESDFDEDNSKSTKQENSFLKIYIIYFNKINILIKNKIKLNLLRQLTKNFLDYIKKRGRVRININDLVKHLNVKKRRIYDITNVLQGIGYIEKKGKNEILWIKNENTVSSQNSKNNNPSENYISNYSQLKDELESLKNQKIKIEDNLNKFREEFKLISEKQDFPKYGYITFKDMTDLSLNEKLNFMLIKAPKGTSINVIDDEEARKAYSKIKIQMENGKIQKNEKLLKTMENTHHIFFNSQDEKLKIYKIENGEIKKQIDEGNNDINESSMINNNIFINNSFEQNKMQIINNYSDKNSNEKNNNPTLNQQLFNFDNFIQNKDKNSSDKKEEPNNINMGISRAFK